MKKSKLNLPITRRQVLKAGIVASAGMMLPWRFSMPMAHAATQGPGLSDPVMQPKFAVNVPNALDPSFIFDTRRGKKNKIKVGVGQAVQQTGLVAPDGVTPVPTTIWGYGAENRPGQMNYTWPGRTFQMRSYEPLEVKWENRLNRLPFPITGKDNTSIGFGDYTGRSVVDESLHWAYSLHGYEKYSIEKDGVPIVPHVHGGHTDFQYDGNPEFFFSPNHKIRGPQWRSKWYRYKNDQPAGTIWYHDHALGITRLNVYAGMAGFYIIRDDFDTGLPGNPLVLPAFPYEAAFAIQDKMFKDNGELFYPAFPGDPFYKDFIFDEVGPDGLPNPPFVDGGPTGLAEFFGDHMVVNGKIWPKMQVEPRNYRLRLLNGCDSRFLVVQFFEVPSGAEDFSKAIRQLDFTVIGSDQGLASDTSHVDTLVMETGSRYDIILDFNQVTLDSGNRVIMKNIGWDTPFGFDYGPGAIEGEDVFVDRQTDRIMAFDVDQPLDNSVPDVTPAGAALFSYAADRETAYEAYRPNPVHRVRKVALFEGTDEFGRLQPILGTAEPATDYQGKAIYWPSTAVYQAAGLTGQMDGAVAWHSPTTENPALGHTEKWEVFNVTGDSHPIHLHLVHFEVLERREIIWDSATTEEDRVLAPKDANGNGTYLVAQPTIQHNSTTDPATWGSGFKVVNPTYDKTTTVDPGSEYADGNSPKDMVTARPDEVTIIRAKFDRPGRYVWHCHILSHEDHEMMRVLHVGPGA